MSNEFDEKRMDEFMSQDTFVEVAGEEKKKPAKRDLYHERQQSDAKLTKTPTQRGAAPIITGMIRELVAGGKGDVGLQRAKKEAEGDSEFLMEKGELEKAEARRRQYMQEYWAPVIEYLVAATSPQEVASAKGISELDKYVMLPAGIRPKGYTRAYVRALYRSRDNRVPRSDPWVREQVRRVNNLLDMGSVRIALGIAERVLKSVKDGNHTINEIDYALLNRVCSYYNY